MRGWSEIILVLTIAVVLVTICSVVARAAYVHSLIEPEAKPWCRGEFGHTRPQSFCDRRDGDRQ